MAPLPAHGIINHEEEEGAEGEEYEDEPEPELEILELVAPQVTAVWATALPESRVRAIAGVEADKVGLQLGVRGTSGEERREKYQLSSVINGVCVSLLPCPLWSFCQQLLTLTLYL